MQRILIAKTGHRQKMSSSYRVFIYGIALLNLQNFSGLVTLKYLTELWFNIIVTDGIIRITNQGKEQMNKNCI